MGSKVLAVLLILWGASSFVPALNVGVLFAVLAIVAGALILLGK